MLLSRVRVLVVLAGLLACAPLHAAPVTRKSDAGPNLERYLPADTDFVIAINVKQVVGTPLFVKDFKKKVVELLGNEAVKPFLKGAGVNVFTDVDHVVVALGQSCYQSTEEYGRGNGPLFFFLGRFDPAALHKKMADLAKEMPKVVAPVEVGKAKLYEISLSPREKLYAGVVNRSALVVAMNKPLVVAALGRADGTKKTAFKYKELPAALKAFKPDLALQAVGLQEMITSTTYSSFQAGGGKTEFKRTYHTLGESGIRRFTVRVAGKDDARVTVEMHALEKGDVDAFYKKATDGLDSMKAELQRALMRRPQMAPLVKAFENVKVKKAGRTITFEGLADAAAVQAFVQEIAH
jgi:hypothetical protein